jgi:hypothetical protein
MGLALAALVLWLEAASPVQADGTVHCVNQTGTGCDAVCGGGCYPSVQAAVDAASEDHRIRIAGGTFGSGGTVAVITKSLWLEGGYITSCGTHDPDLYHTVLDAQWGGSVVSMTNAGSVVLHILTLTRGDGTGNCGTDGCGGAVYAKDTNLHLGVSVITNNVGTITNTGFGGAIYSTGCSHYTEIWGNHIVSNTANATPSSDGFGYGGGIYIHCGPAYVSGNHIEGNLGHVSYHGQGGGLYLTSLTGGDVMTNVISGNKGTVNLINRDGSGGGMFLGNSTGVYVAANQIEYNWGNPKGPGYGAGLNIQSSEVHLARNTVFSNTNGDPQQAWVNPGGGIYISNNSNRSITLTNNLVIRNRASSHQGGGIDAISYWPSTLNLLLINNTFADNYGYGLELERYVSASLTNNIVSGHSEGITTTTPASTTILADTNLFSNTVDLIVGTNTTLLDPRLTITYHLSADSPAVDAGVPSGLASDVDGDARPDGCFYDIGADEFHTGMGCNYVHLPLVLRSF